LPKDYLIQSYLKSNSLKGLAVKDLGHISLLKKDKNRAIDCYKESLTLEKDEKAFFQGMEISFKDLKMETRGISREEYDEILAELKKVKQ